MALATELGRPKVEEVWHCTHPGIDLYDVPSSAEAEQHREGILLLADYAEQLGFTSLVELLRRDLEIKRERRIHEGWYRRGGNVLHHYYRKRGDPKFPHANAICGRVLGAVWMPIVVYDDYEQILDKHAEFCSYCVNVLEREQST